MPSAFSCNESGKFQFYTFKRKYNSKNTIASGALNLYGVLICSHL